RQLKPGPHPRGVVLQGVGATGYSEGADGLPPCVDGHNLGLGEYHQDLLDARRGSLSPSASRAMRSGLTVGSGSSVPSQSSRPSARSTLMIVFNVEPCPLSSFCTVAVLTFARSANSFWVMSSMSR